MSIRSQILNYVLKRYIKKVQPSVEDRSYLEARKMMNQKGYEDNSSSIINTSLQKFIFSKKNSKVQIDEIYLENIRTLSFDHDEFCNDKCILYFHGGGYVAGSPETHQNLLISIAEKSNLKVYAIDYSLAPERPFPAALNDAVESYKCLLKTGYKNQNIFIGGDSAGGNLSIITILKLQETNEPLPSKVFLLSPWADLTGEGSSIKDNSLSDPYLSYDDWLNTSKSMKKNVQQWYAPNQDYTNPLISPVFAKFKNFPQTLIQVSNIEILFSDSIAISKHLKNNNNGVKLSIYKNLPHVWQIFEFLPESKNAVTEILNFLKD